MSRRRARWIRWGMLGVATSLACGSSDEAGLGTTTTSPQGQSGASGAGGGASAGTAGVAGGLGGQAGAAAGNAGGAVTGGSAGKGGAGAIGGSAGQAGGAGAIGGSAGKATAGSAGAPPACIIPALVQGPVGVQSISDTRMEQWPSLQMTSDAGVPAALAFHWTSWPGGTVTGIRTLPLAQPFAPWPDGPVGSSFESTPLMLDGPIVAQTGASDGLAMLFLAFGSSGQRHVGFTRNQPAAGGMMTSIDASPPVAPDITLRPLFVTRGNGASAGDFLVGFERGPEGFYTADVALVDAAGGVAKQPTFGCATAAIEMDAMPTATPSVFRVVGASGKDCCFCSSGSAPGAPTLLMTTRVGAVTETASVVSAGALPIRAVKLVPRSDGAWLVVARAASDTQPTTVELGRADGQGIVAAPAPLFDAMTGRTLSAARYQDGLVVGWIEPDGAASKLEIRLVSAAGELTAASSSPLPHAAGTSPISLLANPSGGGLVVAWSHPTVPPMADSRIAMARLSWGCMK